VRLDALKGFVWLIQVNLPLIRESSPVIHHLLVPLAGDGEGLVGLVESGSGE